MEPVTLLWTFLFCENRNILSMGVNKTCFFHSRYRRGLENAKNGFARKHVLYLYRQILLPGVQHSVWATCRADIVGRLWRQGTYCLLYTETCYSGPALFKKLDEKGISTCGTVNCIRKNMSPKLESITWVWEERWPSGLKPVLMYACHQTYDYKVQWTQTLLLTSEYGRDTVKIDSVLYRKHT